MKLRSVFALLLVMIFAVVLTTAHGKKESAKKTSASKDACCMTAKSEAKASPECKDTDAATCDMSKAEKISMKKTDGKMMDCCKGNAKAVNSKSESKTKSEAKGTN